MRFSRRASHERDKIEYKREGAAMSFRGAGGLGRPEESAPLGDAGTRADSLLRLPADPICGGRARLYQAGGVRVLSSLE